MSKLPRQCVEQAVQWMVILRDEPVPPGERLAFEHWLAADPLHRQTYAQVQGHLAHGLGALAQASPGVRHALQAPRPSRRHLLRGALALAGVGVAATLLGRPGLPLAQITADLRTGTAERRRLTLSDGSELALDAQSAVDVQFNNEQRVLVLRAGRLMIDARHEARPLSVVTPFGQVRSTQARLSVATLETSARAWVLEHQAQVIGRQGLRQLLHAGQGARFDGEGLQALAINRIGETAWHDGWLEAQDWSLAEVVDALRPYCRGVLRVSPEAGAMRVSGSFSLDRSDRALAALEQTLPLRVHRYLGWWTSIDLA